MQALLGLIAIALGGVLGAADQAAVEPAAAGAQQSFTVWQLPNQAPAQMMSYVIRSVGGKLIVIDGGWDSDAPYLKDFIRARGGCVEAWFITHPHDDHVSALIAILRNPEGIEMKALYTSMPDAAWVKEVCSASEHSVYEVLVTSLAQVQRTFTPLSLGQTLDIDAIHIEVLGVCNPEIRNNPLNNSSLVLRFSDSQKSVLFLGDLGIEGGQKLLNSPMSERLPSDYVQMAHHGQNGVGEDVYQRINPNYCLWPTPKWLWDNDNGGGKGSGPWKTEEVRAWMDRLSIRKHYVMFEGLQEIQ